MLFSHIGHVGSSTMRSLWLGLTAGRTSATPTRDGTRRYYQHLNRISANLALLSDVSMAVLGAQHRHRHIREQRQVGTDAVQMLIVTTGAIAGRGGAGASGG